MKVITELPDDAWPGILDALAARRNRPDKVANPAFDQSKPESDSNPRQIDNPESKADFFARSLMEYVAGEWAAYNKDIGLKATADAVAAQIESRKAEVISATKVTFE